MYCGLILGYTVKITGYDKMKAFRGFLQRKARPLKIGVSVFFILYGLAHLLTGKVNYENYWGGLVFAPFTIAIGILLLYIAAFHPNWSGPGRRNMARKERQKPN